MNGITSTAVFLGAPAVLTPGQQEVLDRWQVWHEEELMNIVRLYRGAYGSDPLRAQVLGVRKLKGRHPRQTGGPLLG